MTLVVKCCPIQSSPVQSSPVRDRKEGERVKAGPLPEAESGDQKPDWLCGPLFVSKGEDASYLLGQEATA